MNDKVFTANSVRNPMDCGQATLNWARFATQYEHRNCCHAPDVAEHLAILYEKLSPDRSRSLDFQADWIRMTSSCLYDETGSIIACSSYPRALDFVLCGCDKKFCGDRLFCPRCCARQFGYRLLREFGHAFTSEYQVFYIVLGISKNPDEKSRLKFQGLETSLSPRWETSLDENEDSYGMPFESQRDVQQIKALYDINSDVTREFIGNGARGPLIAAVGGPEIAVRLLPLRVLPHFNLICWTRDFTEADARNFRSEIRKKIRNSRIIDSSIYPALGAFRLASQEDLKRVLQYSMKPVALADAYHSASSSAPDNKDTLRILNRNVNHFFLNVTEAFANRRRIDRFGRCNSVNKYYIGISWRNRRKRPRDRKTTSREGSRPRNPIPYAKPRCSSRIKYLLEKENKWPPIFLKPFLS
jgi:hypothetical protein